MISLICFRSLCFFSCLSVQLIHKILSSSVSTPHCPSDTHCTLPRSILCYDLLSRYRNIRLPSHYILSSGTCRSCICAGLHYRPSYFLASASCIYPDSARNTRYCILHRSFLRSQQRLSLLLPVPELSPFYFLPESLLDPAL